MNQRWFLSMVMALASIAPAAVYGATYYVAKTGSDDHHCVQAQFESTPALTIAAGLACMNAGDTLIVKPGTYAEGINNTIPAGINTSSRTKIIGLNGERWTLRPGNTSQCFNGSGAIYVNDKSFIEVADAILDGVNCTGGAALYWLNGTSNEHILRDSELKNLANGTGLLFQGAYGSRNTVRNVISHHHGNDGYDHCFYPSGSDHVFDRVEGYNCSGHGIHLWSTKDGVNNRNIIMRSNFHDNGSYGIGIYRGSDNQIFGNILVNNGTTIGPSGGLRLSANTTRAYNNTIYNHGLGGRCVRVESSADGSVVRNNLCLNNAVNAISNGGTNTTESHNRLSTDGTLVIDAANGRFEPRENSALIDAGTSTGMPSGIGYTGAAPDQGALEFAGIAIGPALAIPSAPLNLQITP